jgi:hypothetical protein
MVATIDGSQSAVVEAWTDTPDHRFVSVVVRSDIGDKGSVWTETRIRSGGFALFRLEPGQSRTSVDCRSGRMTGWSTMTKGRTIKVLHPDHLPGSDVALRFVPLRSLSGL